MPGAKYDFTPHVNCGEMTELAEGARLEIVCAVYSGTVGSNPTLSAIFFCAWHYHLQQAAGNLDLT